MHMFFLILCMAADQAKSHACTQSCMQVSDRIDGCALIGGLVITV